MNFYEWTDTGNYKPDQKVRWHACDPDFYKYLIGIIQTARLSVHLQYYIIDPDSTGLPILEACKAAAKRGVKVKILADGFGSDKLTTEHVNELESAGVDFRFFKPFIYSDEFYVGRRLHHKIVVIDEAIAIVGGMNIADRYPGNESTPPWIDYAVTVEGDVSKDLAEYCNNFFHKSNKKLNRSLKNMFRSQGELRSNTSWARMRVNDSLRGKREISSSYNRATRRAKSSITIIGGYFLPGRRYRRNLVYASRKGVQIKVILTKNSDVKMVKYASDYLNGFLIRNKIQIYEANETMVHGKVMIVDELYSTVGSYNQNNLSALLSIETNIDIIDQKFSSDFKAHLDQLIEEQCTRVTAENYYKKSTILTQLLRWFSYKILRVSLRILLLLNRVFSIKE